MRVAQPGTPQNPNTPPKVEVDDEKHGAPEVISTQYASGSDLVSLPSVHWHGSKKRGRQQVSFYQYKDTMPKGRRSKSFGRKTGWTRRRSKSAGSGFAARVRSVVRNGLAERKRNTLTETASEVDWTGRRIFLDEIAQGADEGQRIGRIVTPHSFVAKFKIINSQAASATNVAWTCYLVQDKQTVGDSHAAVSEITSNNGTVLAPMGLLNIHNKGRFTIFRRWEGILNQSSLEGSRTYLNLYHKFSPKNTENMRYNGAAATDIEAGSLMLVWISDQDPAANTMLITGVHRLWYTDV